MFKGIDYVYEVYLERSFSKAAKNLFISQPSLSAAIKKIELEVGFEIFDRTTKPIGLTEFGLEYIKSLEKIIEIEENFNNYLNDLSDLKAGNISIGGTNLFTSYILPPIISEFSKKYPNIKLNIVETNTSSLEKNLYSGTLDLVIDNYDFDSSVYERKFYSKDNIMLAVPAKFLSNKNATDYVVSYEDIINGKYLDESVKTLPLEIFKEDPFLFLKEGNDTRIRAEKICIRENVKPNILLELDQQITAFNLTCFGMGISFVSDILLKNVGINEDICIYKLESMDSAREVSFYYKKYKYLKKATQEFIKISESIKN
ncbi:DNA-binding transcriptional regulator, LysR family [Anaerosphaera aminiphila DSM 21120]|uniref:DNA-binding transcriptional regulator, LysR family n=1 Tax=Anaerosphaera aminiphila DSM 21120 TaxID=1120995 RepID=A0A1M5NW06_9FIRM|nr:LysR family transcriptional regulator [Anaerosphaera aminiphila]SHG93721.1 DNA-binding transcriptional regulator, LysR family [Anaerosphaera aminiphila DSM 21120]